jgi:hypothetical protein
MIVPFRLKVTDPTTLPLPSAVRIPMSTSWATLDQGPHPQLRAHSGLASSFGQADEDDVVERELALCGPVVHWTHAAVVEKPGGKKGDGWRVGLADERVVPLSIDSAPPLAQTIDLAPLRRGFLLADAMESPSQLWRPLQRRFLP